MIHWTVQNPAYASSWDSIWADCVWPRGDARMGTTSSAPGGVPADKYGLIINAANYGDSSTLANAVKNHLNASPSNFAAINEINSTQAAKIAGACAAIGTGYGNRWGVYLVNGPSVNFSVYASAIDAVWANWGRLLVELYRSTASGGGRAGAIAFGTTGSTTHSTRVRQATTA